MINRIYNILCVILVLSVSVLHAQKPFKVIKNVDPFIGTGGHGHTYPGATMPFGMVQLSPDTYNHEWDWCSGYHESDKSIMGFSHTHLSGTGGADYGDILLMPTTGDLKVNPGSRENPSEGYRSKFSHENEKASPGYYSVYLDDYKIKAELTATLRAGFHKYTFPKSNESNIVLDLSHGISDSCIAASIKIVSDTEIQGQRRSSGWNNDHTVYFVAKFSKPFKSFGISLGGKILHGEKSGSGKDLKGFIKYVTKENESILVKVGISHVSIEGARKNLECEISDWNFDKIKTLAEKAWEKELSKIMVEGGTKEQNTIFYTALYHSMIVPNIFSDADGSYMGMDGKIHKTEGFDMYTVFSLWDTFRGLHPLLSITDQKRTNDFVNTFLARYNESGLLPVWELASYETYCMIGYHSVPVITDAYMKGIRKYDIEKLYEAMKHSATKDMFGIKDYMTYGYVPSGKERESVSKTLEYAYDDWCISKIAGALGKKDDCQRFSKRALSYMNLFDGSTGFMRGKSTNGNFTPGFNPFAVSSDYTEANAWQYNLFVPHDVKGLINLYGDKKNLIKRLDDLFSVSSNLEGFSLGDITGMIGQYAHGNEPSHHLAYFYNYVGEGYKTQQLVRKITDELYSIKRDGLSGNEDCGQMSAWYVLSAMGFYSVCPGTNEYIIGSPLFKKVTITLENGKHFVINAKNTSEKNKFIHSIKKEGKDYTASFIRYEDIMNGSVFDIAMSDSPNKNWATAEKDLPYSFTNKEQVSVPFLQSGDAIFLDSTSVTLGCMNSDCEIHYTLDGSEPDRSSSLYTKPFALKDTRTIKARGYKTGFDESPVLSVSLAKAEMLESSKPEGLSHGLRYDYYEGNFTSAYDIVKLNPKKSGYTDSIYISLAEKEDHFGIKFSGYINVPQDGLYRLNTLSDDGSILLIDGKEVVNNDGSHAPNIVTGTIGLKAGYHAFTLLYFEDYEGQALSAAIEGPSIKFQPVPLDWFYCSRQENVASDTIQKKDK